MEAVLIIDQAYIDLVREGQPVRRAARIEHARRPMTAKVEAIADSEMKVVSAAACRTQAGGRLETKTDPRPAWSDR